MKKIKVIGLGLFFSLFFVACTTSSSSSSTPTPEPAPSGEKQTLSASPESLSFTFGETNFKTSEVTSNKAGKGKYSARSNNKSVAEVDINSVGLVRVTPISVGDAIITVKRERDSSYDSASQTIKISVNKQRQNLGVNLGTTTSDRWKLKNGTTVTISVAAEHLGGVRGDSDDLVGSTASYSITKIESSTTGDVVKAEVGSAGEIIITAESIGDATVTVSNKGDSNYKKEDVAIFITVNDDATQAALNFTSTDGSTTDADVIYDSYAATVADKNITVAGVSGVGNFSVKSSNMEIVTATVATNGGLITIIPKSAGTAVITVTREGGVGSGGTIYNPISKDIRVTVNKPAAQTLSADPNGFTEIYSKLDDTDDSKISNSSSDGDYYIKSSKPDVATASITSSGTITVLFEQVGTTDIIITQAGNYDYRSSRSSNAAIIDVTVDKATQTLAAIPPNSIDATYVEDGDTTSIRITGGKGTGSFDAPTSTPDNDVVDITNTSITESGTLTVALNQVGTTNITVLKRGDRNYKDSDPLEIGVTIRQAPQNISIEGGETNFQQQLGSTPVTVAILGAKGDGDYTIDSNSNPAVASADFENNDLTLTFGVVGDAEIVFSRNGDRNYENSNRVTIDVKVTTQANQVLTLGDTELTVTYQDTTSANVSIGTDATGIGNAIVASSNNQSVATVTMIDATSIEITFDNVGVATIFVYREGNANFNRSRNRSIEVEVEQASQEIEVATTDVTLSYGETFETLLSGGSAGYKIESNEPTGIVTAEIDSANSMLSIDTRDGKSGTAEIKVFAIENGNYAQSNTLTITVTVNKAAQELTASPSTFNLVYNDTTTSAIATISTITNLPTDRLDDDGKYVLSSNESIVTTDINQESGLLSLRAVGVGDATITIYKQEDSRYLKSDPIEIGVAVSKAGQELTSDITSFSFDKPRDAITFVISGGLSIGEVYTATSDHANIVTTDIDIAGNLSITAIASGDATVTVQRAGDANYNAAADLTIRVRVKTQQTLSLVEAVSVKYVNLSNSASNQRVGRITGGQGEGRYKVVSHSTANIVDILEIGTNGLVELITVSTGDTIVTIYKKGDERYNRSATVDLSVSVARGVVELEYEDDAITIEYSPTVETEISLETLTGIKSTVFTYTATTSDSDNVITRGHKIGVRLNPANNYVVVSTLNADPNPATIRVTRAQTPYYEEATVDISVTVEKADRDLEYNSYALVIRYRPNGVIRTIGLTTPNDVDGNKFIYAVDQVDRANNTIAIPTISSTNAITVTAQNASPIPAGNTDPALAMFRVGRTGDPNYIDEYKFITVRVDRKGDQPISPKNPVLTIVYEPNGDATSRISINRPLNVDTDTTFSYDYTVADNGYMYDGGTTTYPKISYDKEADSSLVVTALGAHDDPVIITVTRAVTRNYEAANAEISVTVGRATQTLTYDDMSPTFTYDPQSIVTIAVPDIVSVFDNIVLTYRVTGITNPDNYVVLNNSSDAELLGTVLTDGDLTVVAQNAGSTVVTVTREETRNYEEANAVISVTVEKADLDINYKYSGTNIPISDDGAVAVEFFTSVSIEPSTSITSLIDTFTSSVVPSNAMLGEVLDVRNGNISFSSIKVGTATLTLEWSGRNYDGGREFAVTTSKGNPIFEYDPPTVTFNSDENGTKPVEQSQDSQDDIHVLVDSRYNVIDDYDKSIIASVTSPLENNDIFSNGDFDITRASGGVGSVDLTVERTFVGSSANNQNSSSTTVTVNAKGLQLYHVDSTDAVLGDYSGLTTVASGDSDYLFIAGQPISGRKVSGAGAFSSTIGGNITASADSITSAKLGDKTYIFTANRDTSTVTVYSFANGSLSLEDSIGNDDDNRFNIGGASALTTATINNKLFLFVAGSTDDSVDSVYGVSAFEVTNDNLIFGGSFSGSSGPAYVFDGASALTTFITADATVFLFVAAKDENAVASYKLQEYGGSITLGHGDNDYTQDIEGALSLAIVSKDASVFLYAAGSTGVTEVEVSSDGAIKRNRATEILPSGVNTFVTVAKKGNTDFLFAAYGNMLKTYVLEDNDGTSLFSTSNLSDTYMDDDNSKFGGVSSLTTAIIDGKLFLFVAGSTDNGVSVFEVRYLP